MRTLIFAALVTAVSTVGLGRPTARGVPGASPGQRVLLDAHNAYEEHGQWRDRLDRALATGVPLAIEQDLLWVAKAGSDNGGRSVVSHGAPATGGEPTLGDFFERIRPIVMRALASDDRSAWPLITVNLDFKSNETEHLEAVALLLNDYASWLTFAVRQGDDTVAPLQFGPVLVLTGEHDAHQAVFHDRLRVGDHIKAFGAVHTAVPLRGTTDLPAPGTLTNYRRWWNLPWMVVEGIEQPLAGEWTSIESERLSALVSRAHVEGLWIRFYTLNGHAPAAGQGWTAGYNFGDLASVLPRWGAAVAAGVDFVASDQYEELSSALTRERARRAAR